MKNFRSFRNSFLSFLVFSTLSFYLCGCDGGGGGDTIVHASPPDNEPTNVTFSAVDIKRGLFEWDFVAKADHFTIDLDKYGNSNFVTIDDSTNIKALSHTFNIPVHRLHWDTSQYAVASCNEDNSSHLLSTPEVMPSSLSQALIGYFKASNTNESDNFGKGIALSADGKTLAVGAVGEDSPGTGINSTQTGNDSGSSNTGAVYIFRSTNGVWAQEAYIKASNPDIDDYFGWRLALSANGDTLVATAFNEDSQASGINGDESDDSLENPGAAYVFTRSGTTWTQQAYIKASNTGNYDYFGYSVDLSSDGNTLAVGAIYESSSATGINGAQDNDGTPGSGAVYLFTRQDSNWSQQAYIKASNTGEYYQFGYSLSLSSDGNTLAVGAMGEESSATGINGNQSDDDVYEAGAAYVFNRTGTSWTQQAYIKSSNTDSRDRFGASVTLSGDGNTLAVGAYRESSQSTGINGVQNNNDANEAGAAYVFRLSNSTWTQEAYFKASNTGAGDGFGRSVTLSYDGNLLAVGAHLEESAATHIGGDESNNDSSDSGAVYIFDHDGTSWTQENYVKATNTGNIDLFGYSVELTADGNTLAVGAYQESSDSTGIGGSQENSGGYNSGAVYLY